MISPEIWADCCDFCVRADDSKREIEPCRKMTARCKGDTCRTCKPCPDFLAAAEFTNALILAKKRFSGTGSVSKGRTCPRR